MVISGRYRGVWGGWITLVVICLLPAVAVAGVPGGEDSPGVPGVDDAQPGEPDCPDEMAVVDGNCCWPGQEWSVAHRECQGTPEWCPEQLEPIGDDCFDTDMSAGDIALQVLVGGGLAGLQGLLGRGGWNPDYFRERDFWGWAELGVLTSVPLSVPLSINSVGSLGGQPGRHLGGYLGALIGGVPAYFGAQSMVEERPWAAVALYGISTVGGSIAGYHIQRVVQRTGGQQQDSGDDQAGGITPIYLQDDAQGGVMGLGWSRIF